MATQEERLNQSTIFCFLAVAALALLQSLVDSG